MLERFEVLSNLGGGIACLAYALALRLREIRPKLIARLIGLLTVVGIALVLRGLHMVKPVPSIHVALLISSGVFPIFAGLFVETLVHQPLPLWTKLLLLLGTALFPALAFSPWYAGDAYALALASYQVVVLAVLAVQVLRLVPKARPGPERTLRSALLAAGILCTGLVITDWLPTFGINTPRLGALGVLVFLYLVAAVLHGGGTFRLRRLLARVLGTLSLAACMALCWAAVEEPMPSTHTVSLALLLFFTYLAIEPVRTALLELRQRPREVLLERLASLPSSSLTDFVATLSTWPELRAVQLLHAPWLTENGYDQVRAFCALHPGMLDAQLVREAESDAATEAQRHAAEQVAMLLTATGLDHLVALGDASQADVPLLGVCFLEEVDAELFRPVLLHIATVATLLERLPKVGAGAGISTGIGADNRGHATC